MVVKSPANKNRLSNAQSKKAGKKRQLAESDEEEDSTDEVDMEELKKLSKKFKISEGDDEDDDSDGDGSDADTEDVDSQDEDEDEDDDEEGDSEDEDEDEEEEDEEEEPTVNAKAVTKKQVAAKQPTTNGFAPPNPFAVDVKNNAVIIHNLDKKVITSSFKNFIAEKSGVKDFQCFVTFKPSAVIVTKTPKDAEKIESSCQKVNYHGSKMQVSRSSSGVVPVSEAGDRLRAIEKMDPSETILLYSTSSKTPSVDSVKKIISNIADIHSSHAGVFVTFTSMENAKSALIKLTKLQELDGVRFMVKYVKNNNSKLTFSGKEKRLYIYNAPFDIKVNEVEDLSPKVSFVHYNPNAPGSWIMEFDSPKDCKAAAESIMGKVVGGRALRVFFVSEETWDLKIHAITHMSDLGVMLKKTFPQMVTYRVMSGRVGKDRRAPIFVVCFKTREAWLKAIDTVNSIHSIGGVKVYLTNNGQKTQGKTDQKKQKAQVKITTEKDLLKKKKKQDEEDDDDEEEEEDGDGEEAAEEGESDEDDDSEEGGDDDDDDEDSGSDEAMDAEEAGSDDEKEDDDDEEDQAPPAKRQSNGRGGGGFTPRGRGRGGGGDGNRGRGGPRGGGGFGGQRGRGGGGFRGRGGGGGGFGGGGQRGRGGNFKRGRGRN